MADEVAADAPAPVSTVAWNELCHARAVYVLSAAGIDSIVLKGVTTSQWLYAGEHREVRDVDILVRHADLARAIRALCEDGSVHAVSMRPELVPGFADAHSVTLESARPAYMLDLHYRFPGSDVPEDEAWHVLWAAREPLEVAGVQAWQLGASGRALMLAIHAARDSGSPKVVEDLRRCLSTVAPAGWADVLDLADRLGARAGLVQGLRTQRAGLDVLAELDLDAAPDATWLLRGAHEMDAAYVLRIAQARGRDRLRLVKEALWPSADFMRHTRPMARRGFGGLAAARLRRAAQHLRELPSVVAAIRRAQSAAAPRRPE